MSFGKMSSRALAKTHNRHFVGFVPFRLGSRNHEFVLFVLPMSKRERSTLSLNYNPVIT